MSTNLLNINQLRFNTNNLNQIQDKYVNSGFLTIVGKIKELLFNISEITNVISEYTENKNEVFLNYRYNNLRNSIYYDIVFITEYNEDEIASTIRFFKKISEIEKEHSKTKVNERIINLLQQQYYQKINTKEKTNYQRKYLEHKKNLENNNDLINKYNVQNKRKIYEYLKIKSYLKLYYRNFFESIYYTVNFLYDTLTSFKVLNTGISY